MTLPAELATSLDKAHARARYAQIALGSIALVDFGIAITLKMQEALLAAARAGFNVAPSEAQANDERVNFATHAGTVLTLVTAFFFLRWFYRALASARWLRNGTEQTAGDAIVAFVIPLVSFVLPFAVMRELYRLADPSSLPLPTQDVELSGAAYRPEVKAVDVSLPKAPIALWWLTYLAMTFVTLAAAFFASSRDLDSLITMSRVAVAGRAFGVVSAVLGILVIHAVDRRLAERARRQAAMETDPEYSVGEE